MQQAQSLGWGVEGQIEKGEQEGTEHYQLCVKTPQARWTQVKKVFPTAHIEPAKSRKALEKYVHKEETRVEALKTIEMTALTYPQVRKKFFEWLLNTYDIELSVMSHEHRLQVWDEFIGLSIEEGMECDLIGMNPQNRACIARYWEAYIARAYSSRQTDNREPDRQTDTQEVSLPMVV